MKTIIHTWKSMSLVNKEVHLPNGKNIQHTSIEHPGACVIIPILPDGDIVLIKQYRPALQQWIWELPAGTLEQGESPLTCAQRELEEESGYASDIWSGLGELWPMAGLCNEKQFLFIAHNVVQKNRLLCDDDEVIEPHAFSFDEIQKMIKDNQIIDAKTLACLYKAQLMQKI